MSSTSARVGVKGLKQWEQDVIQREEEEKRKQKLSGKKKSPKWKRKRKLSICDPVKDTPPRLGPNNHI